MLEEERLEVAAILGLKVELMADEACDGGP